MFFKIFILLLSFWISPCYAQIIASNLEPIAEGPIEKEIVYYMHEEPYFFDQDFGQKISVKDDEFITLELPFAFNYYDKQISKIAISTNGRVQPLLERENEPSVSDYTSNLKSGINILHQDLASITNSDGGTYYKAIESKAVITWVTAPDPKANVTITNPPSDNDLEFQLQISANGKISFHYKTVNTETSFNTGLVPIQGSTGQSVVLENNNIEDQTVLSFSLPNNKTYSDFDGDGISDLVAFRPNTAEWFILLSSTKFDLSNYKTYQLGLTGDLPLIGDFDGDSISDMVVFRPSTSDWFYRKSSENFANYYQMQWGLPGDQALVGDYDGDGISDFTVYRASTGTFYTLKSSSAFNRDLALKMDSSAIAAISLGSNENIPIVGRFTQASQDEYTTIWQLATFWSVKNLANQLLLSEPWGAPGDYTIASDIDGDSISDKVAVRRDNNKLKWYILPSDSEYKILEHGDENDLPQIKRDIDGDGRSDIISVDQNTLIWKTKLSSDNRYVEYQFGLPGDIQP